MSPKIKDTHNYVVKEKTRAIPSHPRLPTLPVCDTKIALLIRGPETVVMGRAKKGYLEWQSWMRRLRFSRVPPGMLVMLNNHEYYPDSKYLLPSFQRNHEPPYVDFTEIPKMKKTMIGPIGEIRRTCETFRPRNRNRNIPSSGVPLLVHGRNSIAWRKRRLYSFLLLRRKLCWTSSKITTPFVNMRKVEST